MKWILLTVVIVLGLTNAEEVPEGRAALRKTTRQSLGSIGGLFFGNSEKDIIIGCMKNGLSKSGADKLQATYDKVYSCMSDTRIFETPENEFISKVEKCSRDAINESKACLPRNQTYYPEFFLDFTKSLIRHKYDHKDLLTNSEIVACLNNFGKYTVQIEYDGCLTNAYQKAGITENIPNSRQEFCRFFEPADKCFPDTLKQYCPTSANINKFFDDYNIAVKHLCQD
uniref:Uncharacterized protein LOC114342414 n=1 Tax=Diabrotica virgifera virgifera TaxID=50390 RepID=A0A6P7GGU7_DIAVI